MKLTTPIIDLKAETSITMEPISEKFVRRMTDQTAHISLQSIQIFKERGEKS